MKIDDLIVSDAHCMNEQEMKATKAGVDTNEYCCVLVCIAANNGAGEGAIYGWTNHCAGELFGDYENCKFREYTCDYLGYY